MIRKLKSDSYRSLLAQDERKNAQATAFALAAGHAVPHPQKSAPSVSIDRIIDARYVLYSLTLLRLHVLVHDRFCRRLERLDALREAWFAVHLSIG
jgi:hypothetical protein